MVSNLLLSFVMLGSVGAGGQAQYPSNRFWSIAATAESNGFEEHLYGLRCRRVLLDDDHAPPVGLFWGVELAGSDGQEVLRGTGSFSPLAWGNDAFGFWFRPLVGIEYRFSEPDEGFGGMLGAGVEFIFKPTYRTQIAVTYDYIFFAGDDTQQFGLAFRFDR